MDVEDQEDEMLALESILETDSFRCHDTSGEIKIQVALKHSTIKVKLKVPRGPQELIDGKLTSSCFTVKFLPPLTLNFTYPEDYPSSSPPEFTLSCAWLKRHQLILLCKHLDEIWLEEKGNVVLYKWCQFLQEESLNVLGIIDTLEIQYESHERNLPTSTHASPPEHDLAEVVISNRAVNDLQNSEIVPFMLAYDQAKKDMIFNSAVFSCSICLEEKHGSKCVRFSGCTHVYCRDCLAEYFTVQIKDGNVRGLMCPAEGCEAQPSPKQVQDLIESDQYERYEKLLLQTTLDTMDDVMYCPLLHCQSPVIVEPESSIAQCPSCSYAFCPFCRLSYHGVSKCKIASSEIQKLCEAYENASPEERKRMEKKYGIKALSKAVEETQSQEWMDSNTRSCPECHANIQKIDGCNKMTCFKCRAYFCWLCMKVLPSVNPYHHFNNPSAKCFNQLFAGADAADDEWWF